jgi:hypothetical protein
VALELAEDVRVSLADHVREDVQPAAVRHPHHDVGDACVGSLVEDRAHDRDQALGALEREALVPKVASVQEPLERLGVVE